MAQSATAQRLEKACTLQRIYTRHREHASAAIEADNARRLAVLLIAGDDAYERELDAERDACVSRGGTNRWPV